MVQKVYLWLCVIMLSELKECQHFPQMPSLQVLQLRISNELWTTAQHTRSQIRGNNSFYSGSIVGGRGGGECWEEGKPSFSNKLVIVQDIENQFLTSFRKQAGITTIP